MSTALAPYFKFPVACSLETMDEEYMKRVPYLNALGCLMYLMIYTRPDLAHSASLLSIYISKLGKKHWDAVKWVFIYLKGIATTRVMQDGLREKLQVVGL